MSSISLAQWGHPERDTLRSIISPSSTRSQPSPQSNRGFDAAGRPGNEPAIQYATWETVSPSQDVISAINADALEPFLVSLCLKAYDESDWNGQFLFAGTVQSMAKHHEAVLFHIITPVNETSVPFVKRIWNPLFSSCNSLRSGLSKNSLLALEFLCKALGARLFKTISSGSLNCQIFTSLQQKSSLASVNMFGLPHPSVELKTLYSMLVAKAACTEKKFIQQAAHQTAQALSQLDELGAEILICAAHEMLTGKNPKNDVKIAEYLDLTFGSQLKAASYGSSDSFLSSRQWLVALSLILAKQLSAKLPGSKTWARKTLASMHSAAPEHIKGLDQIWDQVTDLLLTEGERISFKKVLDKLKLENSNLSSSQTLCAMPSGLSLRRMRMASQPQLPAFKDPRVSDKVLSPVIPERSTKSLSNTHQRCLQIVDEGMIQQLAIPQEDVVVQTGDAESAVRTDDKPKTDSLSKMNYPLFHSRSQGSKMFHLGSSFDESMFRSLKQQSSYASSSGVPDFFGSESIDDVCENEIKRTDTDGSSFDRQGSFRRASFKENAVHSHRQFGKQSDTDSPTGSLRDSNVLLGSEHEISNASKLTFNQRLQSYQFQRSDGQVYLQGLDPRRLPSTQSVGSVESSPFLLPHQPPRSDPFSLGLKQCDQSNRFQKMIVPPPSCSLATEIKNPIKTSSHCRNGNERKMIYCGSSPQVLPKLTTREFSNRHFRMGSGGDPLTKNNNNNCGLVERGKQSPQELNRSLGVKSIGAKDSVPTESQSKSTVSPNQHKSVRTESGLPTGKRSPPNLLSEQRRPGIPSRSPVTPAVLRGASMRGSGVRASSATNRLSRRTGEFFSTSQTLGSQEMFKSLGSTGARNNTLQKPSYRNGPAASCEALSTKGSTGHRDGLVDKPGYADIADSSSKWLISRRSQGSLSKLAHSRSTDSSTPQTLNHPLRQFNVPTRLSDVQSSRLPRLPLLSARNQSPTDVVSPSKYMRQQNETADSMKKTENKLVLPHLPAGQSGMQRDKPFNLIESSRQSERYPKINAPCRSLSLTRRRSPSPSFRNSTGTLVLENGRKGPGL